MLAKAFPGTRFRKDLSYRIAKFVGIFPDVGKPLDPTAINFIHPAEHKFALSTTMKTDNGGERKQTGGEMVENKLVEKWKKTNWMRIGRKQTG